MERRNDTSRQKRFGRDITHRDNTILPVRFYGTADGIADRIVPIGLDSSAADYPAG
jgi:hypothetical protein